MVFTSTPLALALLANAMLPAPGEQQPTIALAAYTPRVSNIEPSDTRSIVAPVLPSPPVAPNEPPRAFLLAARTAVEQDRTGEAQEALERAETRLLDRPSTATDPAGPDLDRAVLDIAVTRRLLAANNQSGALRAINDALLADTTAYAPGPAPIVPPAAYQAGPGPMPLYPGAASPSTQTILAQPLAPPPAVPIETYRLLAGHWQLSGANYEWVPPETVLRCTAARSFVAGRYEWRDGAWIWVPTHYGD